MFKINIAVYALNTNNNEYNFLNYNEYTIKKNEINNDNSLNIDSLKKEIDYIIKKYKLNIFNKDKVNNLNEEEFELKIKQGYNYPVYPNNEKGKFLLIYIRKYLLKK